MTATLRRLVINALCIVTALWYCAASLPALTQPEVARPAHGFACSCRTACPATCPCCSRVPAAPQGSSLCSCDDTATDSVSAGPALHENCGSPSLPLLAVNTVATVVQYPRSGHRSPTKKPPRP